jgi:hypothetical protein
MPPAPGLFSMITGWPSRSLRPFAVKRAALSVLPPGENGTIQVIGRFG